MHILALFEPELLHADSYGDISQTHITGILQQNRARSVDFFMQVKQALRHFWQKNLKPWYMTDIKLNALNPAPIICMTHQFAQAQNKTTAVTFPFYQKHYWQQLTAKILKILKVYSKYSRHADDDHHHRFCPLTRAQLLKEKSLSNNTVQNVLTGNVLPHTSEDRKLNTYVVVHTRNTQFANFPPTPCIWDLYFPDNIFSERLFKLQASPLSDEWNVLRKGTILLLHQMFIIHVEGVTVNGFVDQYQRPIDYQLLITISSLQKQAWEVCAQWEFEALPLHSHTQTHTLFTALIIYKDFKALLWSLLISCTTATSFLVPFILKMWISV